MNAMKMYTVRSSSAKIRQKATVSNKRSQAGVFHFKILHAKIISQLDIFVTNALAAVSCRKSFLLGTFGRFFQRWTPHFENYCGAISNTSVYTKISDCSSTLCNQK